MTTRPPHSYAWVFYAGTGGFVAGMVVMAGLVAIFPSAGRPSAGPAIEAPESARPSPVEEVRPSAVESPPAMSANAVEVLRNRRLDLPVKGATREDLRHTFDEQRGSSRRHEAIDMLAPTGTPIAAVEDGTIAKLLLSEAGGITIYQFDPSSTYVYYYAHLDAYANGLKEGDRVTRGDLLGYVGSTGNAPKDTPHLHFAIFQMTEKKQWWQGTPVDPYTVLR
jgi:murein DD-endopeptidase MepM/ murein hydrolase activator NlpD